VSNFQGPHPSITRVPVRLSVEDANPGREGLRDSRKANRDHAIERREMTGEVRKVFHDVCHTNDLGFLNPFDHPLNQYLDIWGRASKA
jgi:hypothetical protein